MPYELLAIYTPQWFILLVGLWIITSQNRELRERIESLEEKLDHCLEAQGENEQ